MLNKAKICVASVGFRIFRKLKTNTTNCSGIHESESQQFFQVRERIRVPQARVRVQVRVPEARVQVRIRVLKKWTRVRTRTRVFPTLLFISMQQLLEQFKKSLFFLTKLQYFVARCSLCIPDQSRFYQKALGTCYRRIK